LKKGVAYLRDDTAFTYCSEVNRYQDLSKLKFSRSSQVCATPEKDLLLRQLVLKKAPRDKSSEGNAVLSTLLRFNNIPV
jgi:hypothetical protein